MAYGVNPFLERRSENTTSDVEFALAFSPKILEKLADNVFREGVHIFGSAPGGGKTTIFRAFTPGVLRGFLRSKGSDQLRETFSFYVNNNIIEEKQGPKLLGVLLSCASGYADLPPGAASIGEGPFRALLDCRVVLRTLRSLGTYLGLDVGVAMQAITLGYENVGSDLQHIPKLASARELADWAEDYEKRIYANLDSFAGQGAPALPTHPQFESILWLQSVAFFYNGRKIDARRQLMIDDVHRLRLTQRDLLVDELTIQRPRIPVWLAMRTLVLGDRLLSQGARSERDIQLYVLEDLWNTTAGSRQFASFASSILDKRMTRQEKIPGNFSQQLREYLDPSEAQEFVQHGLRYFHRWYDNAVKSERYVQWFEWTERNLGSQTSEPIVDMFVVRILIARDLTRKQLSFDLEASSDEIHDKETSSLRAAAEIHAHEGIGLPYYFGLDRLCVMATCNVDELLALAAALYEGLLARQILRTASPELPPAEQEKILSRAASRRFEFIPKNHTEGTRAKNLIASIGGFCRERTFLPNAPIAPGVTGVRLSQSEMDVLQNSPTALGEHGHLLKRVLSECIADNLLVLRESSATTGREAGSIFYLNRTLCAHFGLPLQLGGWQDVSCKTLIEWLFRGWRPSPTLSRQLGL